MFEDNNARSAVITNVVDGDTFDVNVNVNVNLGYGITVNLRFRIFGINAPEVFGTEKKDGIISKQFVVDNF